MCLFSRNPVEALKFRFEKQKIKRVWKSSIVHRFKVKCIFSVLKKTYRTLDLYFLFYLDFWFCKWFSGKPSPLIKRFDKVDCSIILFEELAVIVVLIKRWKVLLSVFIWATDEPWSNVKIWNRRATTIFTVLARFELIGPNELKPKASSSTLFTITPVSRPTEQAPIAQPRRTQYIKIYISDQKCFIFIWFIWPKNSLNNQINNLSVVRNFSEFNLEGRYLTWIFE